METVVREGIVLDPAQRMYGRYDLLIRDGLVAEIASEIHANGREVVNARGLIIFPGFIDLHTHLREPGGEEKETVASGSRAAAAGGFTGITALPNTKPVMDDGPKVEYMNMLAARAGLVRVWPVGAATRGSGGRETADIGAMVESGIRAVTDDGYGVQDNSVMREALFCCRQYGIPFFQHCEDDVLAAGGLLHDGATARHLGVPGIPSASETKMLARDLKLAAETGAHLHVMHLSAAESVEMIRQAKAEGIHVTAEVTPHHLLLTESAAAHYNTMAKMKPPLRTEADRAALRRGLADGTIDAVATDHAPHTETEKASGFFSAPFGIVGLETAFPLLYTHLVLQGQLTLERLVEAMTSRPAAILGVPYGTLGVGSAADLVAVDIDSEHVIDRSTFFSKGKNTPFHGWPVKGVPALTMVGGRIVMRDRQIEGCDGG